MSRMHLSILLILSLLAFVACDESATDNGENGAEGDTPADAEEVVINIEGSNTLLRLSQMWAEEWGKTHPNWTINISGQGSGAGLASLLAGNCDVANASRAAKAEEMERAAAEGEPLVGNAVAYDGLAIIVNENNPINWMTMEQVGRFFKEEADGGWVNWNQLEGQTFDMDMNHEVTAISRDSSSGTYEFFREHVMDKDDYAARCVTVPGNPAIVSAVAENPWAIGYAGLGYVYVDGQPAEGIKILRICLEANEADAALPSVATVLDGSYPVSRPLYMYTRGEATGNARTYLNWIKSDDGQRIVLAAEFVPLRNLD